MKVLNLNQDTDLIYLLKKVIIVLNLEILGEKYPYWIYLIGLCKTLQFFLLKVIIIPVILIKNIYSGGIIAPGVRLSLNTLSDKASLIPKIDLKQIENVIGNNTISAVRSGFFWGYAGLIDNIIYLIKKETRKSFKVIITGGFSNLFKKSIKTKVCHNKDITINGLIKISKLIK